MKRGSVYVAREIYERFFPGLETVILLRRADDLLILPVRSAVAGGFMLKLRNRAGDRVVNAAEFFRDNGIDDDCDLNVDVEWSEAQGGLEGLGFFALQR